jgi:hypothetical protein
MSGVEILVGVILLLAAIASILAIITLRREPRIRRRLVPL